MALIPRLASPRLKALLKQFPIVCLLGPRQCGKTTLAKLILPGWRYLDLEKPSDLVKVEEDPEDALRRWEKNIIFDEAQRLPSLFPVLRSFVDELPDQKGLVVLLGSVSPGLLKNISESLSGRVGFLDMSPFLVMEVRGLHQSLWLHGGFPHAYFQEDPAKRFDWIEAYIRTLVERDLHQLGIEVSSAQMRKLLSMLAHAHGGIWNASEFGASLGVSYHTINRYVDILEQTFLVRRLPPYYANLGKRLVKSPKIYLRDSGLLHYFLGVRDKNDLEGHPKRGASWEGFVIEQILSYISAKALGLESFFWRTATHQEVDLILKRGGHFIPIEIKTHTSPKKEDVTGLFSCMHDLDIKQGYVIRPRGESYSLGQGVQVLSLDDFFDILG